MAAFKKYAGYALRRTRLLETADRVLLGWSLLRNWKDNRRFLSEHPEFVPPPARLAYDAFNHTNWQLYYSMGRAHAILIQEILDEFLPRRRLRICEWGCGPARVCRHLPSLFAEFRPQLFGTDFNSASIDWCRQNIKGVVFRENRLEPPLPFESGFFDAVYSISVFTHLSLERHQAWIMELGRVLKPGGLLVFTTHGDTCARDLLPVERNRYAAGEFVARGKIKEGKKYFTAYQPPLYIRQVLLRDWTILRHYPDATAHWTLQEVWVARAPGESPLRAQTAG